MECRTVLHHCSRLSAAVAVRAVAIQRVDAMLAELVLNAVPPFIGLVVWYLTVSSYSLWSLHPEPKDIER